ncbi:DUF4255 domain-containing protein [Caballeronia novacaledonica]|uniref:DUF4255 domain-containing protein n=1 Tax=Caballeronia novacaledonica TaxID=1544861 RepID=A0AA37ILD3_9BURK|nr:DUF4255 domain-containing protein [Caballeronia novacaledonica]GJH28931.1 DUF4255 domain-containing protein [Caballeronia novacaledonica]
MIEDVSETLRSLLQQPGLPDDLRNAQIVFDPPAGDFAPVRTTIDLFLFQLREDHDARVDEKIMSLACTYLVTAWVVGGNEPALGEHRLLSQVLQALMAYPFIPAPLLKGQLAKQNPLPHLLMMRRDASPNFSEFWSSLGCKPRPSLIVTVMIGVPIALAAERADGAVSPRSDP